MECKSHFLKGMYILNRNPVKKAPKKVEMAVKDTGAVPKFLL